MSGAGGLAGVLPCTEEVTARDIAVIEAVLEQIDRKNSFREDLVLWKFAFNLFKKFDLHFTCLKDRSRLEKPHRMLLEAMTSTTTWVVKSNCLNEKELAQFQLSIEALDSALHFLQRKFRQWYVPLDENKRKSVDAVLGAI